jgi:integrase
MTMNRKKTKYTGVYERHSDVKKHKGKPDVCFDITYKLEGKKYWEKVGWKSEGYSEKLADAVRAERLRSIRHGHDLPRQRKKQISFKEMAAVYLEWAENNNKSADVDRFRYGKHLSRRFDNKKLGEITPFSLERLKSDLTKEGLSPASVRHVLVLVSAMFKKAIEFGLYEGKNPVKAVKLPTLQNERERFLSYEEAKLLLQELQKVSTDAHDMALLSLHTGMRAGEIFGLRGHDIDQQHGLITVLNTKNRKTRKCFMTDAVKELFRRRIPETAGDYIFTIRNGDPYKQVPDMYRSVANQLFNKGVKDPRQKVTFHTLRHTFASLLVLQGESLLTIQELLGHKFLQTTQRYAHILPDEKRKATQKLEKAFSEKRTGKEAVREGSQ